ncbi:MAG TPA: hypothetical protein VJH97_06295, partial [Candidatus Nanoarchaeia archaeon]|nr:hypothetical protein [Candidatus Nanoarchaeia archaeon]
MGNNCKDYLEIKKLFKRELALIERSYLRKEIPESGYLKLRGEKIDGKTREEWIQVCDAVVSEYRPSKIPAVAVLILLVVAASFFIFKPTTIGYATYTKEITYSDEIGRSFNGSSEYVWFVEHPDLLQSIKVSGSIYPSTTAKVYIDIGGVEYNLFDSSSVQTIQARDMDVQPVADHISLSYASDSVYDSDNNGIESTSGLIDFAVDSDILGSNLCTVWSVLSLETNITTAACYGDAACCALNSLSSSSDNWNDEFILNYGFYGATYNNIVKAKVWNADYEVSVDDPSADISSSAEANLSAVFMPDMVDFSDVCVDTCVPLGAGQSTYLLRIETDGPLSLDSIVYTTLETVPNKAPTWQSIPSQRKTPGELFTINLSNYASDPDNDSLTFKASAADNISITIANGIATVLPDTGYTGSTFIFFTANDSIALAVSNTIEINFKPSADVNKSEEVKQGIAVLGKPVKWTKNVKLNNSASNISINISKE